MRDVLDEFKPDIVFVHGDTTTASVASLAAFYKQVKVAHVEAGLRTGDIYSPFPEEINRQLVGIIASYHFAPTNLSKQNLIKENKAKLITTGEDIAKEFLWDLKNRKSKTDKLTCEEKIVFLQLSEELGLEEIMKKIQNFNMSDDTDNDKNKNTLFENEGKLEGNKVEIPLNKLLSILMSLKVKGLITETGTAKYMRIV